ncbi:conserved hypothetical protein [Candidatus Accumulibacter aalborgensis]|uniref:Putative DNA-binding domain-containing protein n=1 Tax=Candidatus Accumulibacter aalborgensis TaxID=1860102 RepID=A0A1A8XR00_9PROT|nr:DNA-binding domain-containing protein [Candidatus Accumulibacter aalborgensis]SBT07081.1 conserved hypothetical protein [Candidatus Accumulibacter aalborgensis]
MSALGELQQRFQRAVLSENPAPGLFVAEGTQPVGGFDLYLQAYRARLAAALRDNFPVLHRALGDDAFATLARSYIDLHPSHFRSIRWFGDALPGFLADAPERVPHPALVDLARMDWAMRAAFDAADAIPLSFGDLASLQPDDWPGQHFVPVRSLQVLDLSWSIEPIWKALNDAADAATDEPQALPHALLIWRPALDCCWRSAEAGEAAALRALSRGASFADWCTVIAAAGDPQPAMTAATLLRRWLDEGLLAKAETPA